MLIRLERPSDDPAIDDLTVRAFAPMSYSDGSEAPIIPLIATAGRPHVVDGSEEGGTILGHVAFSPLTIDGVHAGRFGLGPIAVEPSRQRSGIGKLLVFKAFEILKERSAVGVTLIGSPSIYSRMGFESDGLLTYKNVETRLVQKAHRQLNG